MGRNACGGACECVCREDPNEGLGELEECFNEKNFGSRNKTAVYTKEVEEILKNKEQGNLGNHLLQRRERYLPCSHSKHFGHGMEEPYLKKFDSHYLIKKKTIGRGDDQTCHRQFHYEMRE